MSKRIEKVREALEERGIEALLLTRLENIRYLTGFTGDNAVLLVAPGAVTLVTDGRYREQAARESPGIETVVYTGELTATLADLIGGATVGFETIASFGFHENLAAALPQKASLVPVEGLVEGLRSVKDPGEIEQIKYAIKLASEGFKSILPELKPGVTERKLSAELDYRMVLSGADGPAFDTVVASGPNSALPHAGITDRALSEGDLVIVDFGARSEGYCSDVTRTLIVGSATGGENARKQVLIEAVEGALHAALSALKPGVKASEVYGAARSYLEERGLERYFTHALGHGVGLEVHEKPGLSPRSDDTLEPGMVFTVEPGVYIEGWGGARREEMVLMTGEGPELLTKGIG